MLEQDIKDNHSSLIGSIYWNNYHFDNAIVLRTRQMINHFGIDGHVEFENKDTYMFLTIMTDDNMYKLSVRNEPYLSFNYSIYDNSENKLGDFTMDDMVAFALGFDYGNFFNLLYKSLNVILKHCEKETA